MPLTAEIVDRSDPPTRLQIAAQALQLHELGMTYGAIASALGVSEKTVARAVRDTRRNTLQPEM